MATEVKMPKLTQTMDEGKILDWLVSDGQTVEKGDMIATVETDKATVELEAPSPGVLRQAAAAGDAIPVGRPIAYIAAPGEALPGEQAPAAPAYMPPVPQPPPPPFVASPPPEAPSWGPVEIPFVGQPAAEPQPQPAAPLQAAEPAAKAAMDEERMPSSPRARRLAQEIGIDITGIRGSGPGGRIVEEDVRRAAEEAQAAEKARQAEEARRAEEARAAAAAVQAPPQATPEPTVIQAAAPAAPPEAPAAETPLAGEVELVAMSSMRKAIAERMAQSARETAAVTITMDIDMTEAVALREQMLACIEKESAGSQNIDHYTRRLRQQLVAESQRQMPRPSFTDMIVKAVAMALAEHPHINSRWTDQGIELVKDINVGVAVALGDSGDEGLVVPVIRSANQLPLVEISRRMAAAAERARQRRLSMEEFSGGTFTITNLGMYGVDSFTPIINPPEAAILGVGRIAPRPVVLDGTITARSMMVLSLTIDHRVIDGAAGAIFLRRVRDILQNPIQLLL